MESNNKIIKSKVNQTYSQQQSIKYAKDLLDILNELPDFCMQYFDGMEYSKQPRTKVAYAMDIRNFFEYLLNEIDYIKHDNIKDITLKEVANIKAQDINNYMRYIKAYTRNNNIVTNTEVSAKRKLSSIRSLYSFLFKYDLIENNPTQKVEMPKLHNKAITRLEVNEVAEFLDNVESGNKLTATQLRRHDKLKCRDLALLSLMLGTGIRVSECVGLDIKDVDFENDRIKVVRKGGTESFVYFGDEVRDSLLDYMEERKKLNPDEGHENALFISSKNKRLCVRSVELLVKKYANTVTTVKHITPHKLRSTYGTNLYQETKDIYLVADVLGHQDVNTTRKHYAELVEENKRNARNVVKLRRD